MKYIGQASKTDDFDDYSRCIKCGGRNECEVKEAIEHVVAEVSTKCDDCGFENYWAYGYCQKRNKL